jgi:hypothetical protein
MKTKLEYRIESEVGAVKRYAIDNECSIGDAYEDIINDGPCTEELARAVAAALNLEVAEDFYLRCTSQSEVNQYYRELYDN